VREGSIDNKLVLRRRLRRRLDDYKKNVPPHVRAARLAERERARQGLSPAYANGGWIEYVMTVNGPEPLRYARSPLDYDFYIDRQLAPIADAVLTFQQTSLAQLIDQQLGLFQ
jgi:DNA polymerase-2